MTIVNIEIDQDFVQPCTMVRFSFSPNSYIAQNSVLRAFLGVWSCTDDEHIHIDCSKEFIGSLIARAEVEIQDGRRERHAKTLDVAQEEILTCIGIYLFDKFDKIHRTMRSEEQIWRLLLCIGIDCLRLSMFDRLD